MKLISSTEPCQKCGGTGKEVNHVAIGRQLLQLRNKAKLSIYDIAQSVGVSAPYISDLERGRRNWNEELIAKYEKACQ